MELNPNHPVTQAAHDHWHKLAAVLMCKFGLTHVVITVDDLKQLPDDMFITLQELHDGLHLTFVDEKTAHELARKHGGRPT
jgi:hypothetical protein